MKRIITFIFILSCCGLNAQKTAGITQQKAPEPQKTIRGTVTDARTGIPLNRASVTIKGTRLGIATDTDGRFSISFPYKPTVMAFSYLGYEQKEIMVNATDSVVAVTLQVAPQRTQDVVVVGYATRTKKDMTYSVATVPAGTVQGLSTTYSTPLQGKAGGLYIQGNSGAAVRIRGIASPPPKNKRKSIGIQQEETPNTESYKPINENPFKFTGCEPVSTFAADIDRASYSNVRRFLKNHSLPPADAVKVEEMINYFDYDYPDPDPKEPYSIYTELTECPWNTRHQLMRIALKCKKNIPAEEQPANLVFLVDVSGSMEGPDRLGLVVESFKLLLDSLSPNNRVAIVTYAGSPGLALPSTPVSEKEKILAVLNNLSAGGSTAGGQGIELAYETARKNFIEGGNNRVILATDGDFNVGVTSNEALQKLIEKQKESGIFLTCLGFGTNNYKDDIMEALADKGNGNYYYIDQVGEAKRVLQKEFRGTLNVVAKDVKLQAEFNPKFVRSYRLIGYENRLLNKEDFDNDAKDAGELGEGHTLTALYEIVPATEEAADSLGCNKNLFSPESNELAVIRTRYKLPDGNKSQRKNFFVINNVVPFEKASANTRLAASVAMMGMLLRGSAQSGNASAEQISQIATTMQGDDYVREFMGLVDVYAKIMKK